MSALAPIQTRTRELRLLPMTVGNFDAKLLQPGSPLCCHNEPLCVAPPQIFALFKNCRHFNREASGEMRITSARISQRSRRTILACNVLYIFGAIAPGRRDRQECLNRVRHFRIRKPVIPMSSLLLDRENSTTHKFCQMAARGLWRDIRNDGELSGGQRDVPKKGHHNRSSSRIAQQQCRLSKVLSHAHSLRRQKKEHFGVRRNVLCRSTRSM
jgi:hypothetical protein